MTLAVGSLFSGIGGLDLGLERAGMTVAWQCEVDEKCRELLTARWPGAPVYDDVRTVQGDAVGRVDVLCGGFPCQDLSVAGGRAGLAGERSGLFHQFMRLADEIAPRWVVIENVPGLLSSNDGRDMGVVVGVLGDLGYGWCYRVLDAQYFGVAQRRRRVFIVGCLGDPARAAQVLLEPESCDRDSPPLRAPREAPAFALTSSVGTRGVQEPDHSTYVVATTLGSKGTGNDTDRMTFLPVAVAFSENQQGQLRESPYSPALGGGGGKPGQGYPAVRQGMGVRRLTPLECERLQGFPDGWTTGFSDNTRYQMLGNAVAVPCAAWIGQRIMAAEAVV